MFSTVEIWYNEVSRDWENVFLTMGVHYIRVLFCSVARTEEYHLFNTRTFKFKGIWRAACKKLVSDFLGRIVFPRPNELNFGMWPSTSQKNIPPYLSLLVSLSSSTNNVCKNAVFFRAVSFPKKAFVFPNNRISEARISRQCWLKKVSRKRKEKQQKKIRDNVFLLSPRSHAKTELIWTRKKNSA